MLTVESGLNDGIVAPVFLLCLAGVETHGTSPGPASDSVIHAFDQLLWAAVAGVLVARPGGRLLRRAWRAHWTTPPAIRLGLLALPLLAYAVAGVLHGNGFVTAFVAGLCVLPDVP